ncbi:hypothetical protein DKX38_026318 [Salix brachista]|uniref:DUF4283 domain-containing protein n=1 Tax=Salix brachista TaxID=2182728 RepID=A0A5N5JRT9_9ROSI|nr:hypothetical protein DKX38_026318 [Salix brachista]
MNNKDKQQPQSTWAERVRVTNSSTRFSLDPIPRCTGEAKLTITDDCFMDDVDQWTRCLVGFFPGFRLPFQAVNTIASRIWKHCGLEHVMATSNGFILFRFKTEDELHEVLGKGPWMFGGKNIILQQWHPHYSFDKSKITTLPMWIRLKGLPFPLWTKQGLSHAASMVGKPLSCDEHAHECTRLDYARVCVEVDATLPYVHHFEIDCTLSADPIRIEVEYEWKPKRSATTSNTVPVLTTPQPPPPQTLSQNTPTATPTLDTTVRVASPKPQPDKQPNQDTTLALTLDKQPTHHTHLATSGMFETDAPICLENRMASIQSQSKDTSSPRAMGSTGTTSDTGSSTPSMSTKGKEPMDNGRDTSPTLSWNTVRKRKGGGRKGSPPKQKAVALWITKNCLEIIGLLETKIADNNLGLVQTKLSTHKWSFITNTGTSTHCRIMMGWNPSKYNITCINHSPQWITCMAQPISGSTPINITFVYGLNSPGERRELWDYLKNSSVSFNSLPWVMMGDFNAILNPTYKDGGDKNWYGHSNDFANAILSAADNTSARMLASTGIPWNAKVSSIIRNRTWNLPTNCPEMEVIWEDIRSQPHGDREDKITWIKQPSGIFNIHSAWEKLRERKPEMITHKLLWYPNNIPRQSFILWLAMQGRLRTMDRGYCQQTTNCVLCGQEPETHSHLFFECPYSRAVWTSINARAKIQWRQLSWINLIHWASGAWAKRKDFQHLTARLILSSTVYFLWYERNRRIFTSLHRPSREIAEDIYQLLRAYLANLGRLYQPSPQEREIWNF